MTASGHFRLLDLPRELRDIIYEHALTEKAGLVVLRSSPSRVRPLDDPYGPDPNPLKLVCHQLYEETTGLGLRYNQLNFGGSCSFRLFKDFVKKHCSPAHFGRVKSIVIFQESKESLWKDLVTADKIGKRYPALSIEIRCRWMTECVDCNTWIWSGVNMQYTVSGTFSDLVTAEYKNTLRQAGRRSEDGFGADSKNVQVFPGSFDEERLRVCIIQCGSNISVDAMVALFKKWFQEGF